MMALDCTIEQIRSHFAFVGAEIEELRSLVDRILEKLEEGVKNQHSSELVSSDFRQQVDTIRRMADDLIARVESSATRIKKLGQLAREAV